MKRSEVMVLVLLISGGVSLAVRERAMPRLEACVQARHWPPCPNKDSFDHGNLTMSQIAEEWVRRVEACTEAACSTNRRFELEDQRDYGTLGAIVLWPIGVIAGLVMMVRRRRIRLRPVRSLDVSR